MQFEKLGEIIPKEEKKIVTMSSGQRLEINYDPKTGEIQNASLINKFGHILEYENLKEVNKLEEKIEMLKAMDLKSPEKYIGFIE